MTKPTTEHPARLLLVAAMWIAAAFMLFRSAPLIPRSVAQHLTLHEFFIGVLVVAGAAGIGMCVALVAAPRHALAAGAPRPSHVALALIATPIVTTLGLYLGFELALDTLIAELKAGGRQAAQANAGEFTRAIVRSDPIVTALWALLFTPVVEELMFRGALWGGLDRAIRRVGVKPNEERPSWLSAWIATVATTALFTWLHADQPGGVGIVRTVQAACLGLAAGLARHATGNIWPAMAMHALYNALALAKLRKWLPITDMWPPPLPVPVLFWHLALVSSVVLAMWLVHRWPKARSIRLEASIYIGCDPSSVFAYVVDPQSIVNSFRGHGPIPGAVKAEITSGSPDGTTREGATRRVENSDGSVVEETIVAVVAPTHHAYEIVRGLKPPFSLLVSGGKGDWQLDPEGDGTGIVWRFCWRVRSGWLWPVARAVSIPFQKAMRRCLENHRAHLETR